MKITFFCVLVVIYYLHPTVSVPPPCVEDGQEYPPEAQWTVVVNGECEGRSCSRTGELSMSGCPKIQAPRGLLRDSRRSDQELPRLLPQAGLSAAAIDGAGHRARSKSN
ncbi:uncharacterized protein LOC124366525 [Homalodisca vitripennis]|uniref:uncharacterized protein LOC124366525 n=1 Tax=Homalodisca vitripennis TaxID=197043 RepID=UPI001EEB5280|nr:uncharacterized protein LOC124366525 [Homalodisca vitripennis]